MYFVRVHKGQRHSSYTAVRCYCSNEIVRLCLYILSMSPFFVPFRNGFKADLWRYLHVMSKKIKGAAHKNGDIDGMCKQALSFLENLRLP